MSCLKNMVFIATVLTAACGKNDAETGEVTGDNGAGVAVEEESAPAAAQPRPAGDETPKAAPEPAENAPDKAVEDNAASADNEENSPASALPTGENTASPTPGAPYLLEREGVQITALILARGVEKDDTGKRMPVEPGAEFVRDDRRVYAIVDLANPAETEGELMVGWIKPGTTEETNTVTLSVKAQKSWRTWAFNKFVNKEPGVWQVVIRDSSDNTVLARAAFEMKE